LESAVTAAFSHRFHEVKHVVRVVQLKEHFARHFAGNEKMVKVSTVVVGAAVASATINQWPLIPPHAVVSEIEHLLGIRLQQNTPSVESYLKQKNSYRFSLNKKNKKPYLSFYLLSLISFSSGRRNLGAL
jgi:hypothetical protein